MEEIDRKSHNESPDIPKVPIKTYRWEDVRRSRKRGAYPWTHLTKPPFDGDVDPEEYTMDAFRRSRSTSTLGKSETQEVTDVEMSPKSEDEVTTDDEILADKENVDDVNVQKASVSAETLDVPESGIHGEGKRGRAQSEEPYNKRKLSVDSGYSRISLPKLKIMDRLKTAKSKLKVPKFSKRSRSEESSLKDAKKQKIVTSNADKKQKMQTIKDQSPVYIHIPLKPPPGETDEYSKYEFDSLNHSPAGSTTNVNAPLEKKRKTSLLGLLTQIKLVHDQQVARRASQTSVELKIPTKLKSDSDDNLHIEEVIEESLTNGQEETATPTVEIEESGSTIRTDLDDSMRSDKVTIEEVLEEVKKIDKNETDLQDQNEDDSADDNISQYLDKDEKCEVPNTSESTIVQVQEKHLPDPEKLRKLEATLSKWKKQVPVLPNLELPPPLPIRARSEEPKPKRRSSIDSSHSRKSLSKLAFIKKIKQAKNKIKLPNFPSFSKFDKKSKPPKPEAAAKPVEKTKKLQPTQSDKPVYIHIPLKLPPGESDEFSHLESEVIEEDRTVISAEEEKAEEEVEEIETPDVDGPENNVQLIILTPPSDDEILDSAGPETPCETDQKFFESLKIEDLKTLAKHAVDTVYPDSKLLETVNEAEDNQEIEEDPELKEQKGVLQLKHQVLVDEEDGLKLSEVAIAMINEELEKEYNQQALGLKSIIKTEMSPILKKKVSFKRKSKVENGGPIYEDVNLNKSEAKTTDDSVVAHSVVIPLESFQSMSVDEEKSYLDKEIIKTTSLEDDYNKWSKSNDHEYEPINPPPEVVSIQSPPIIHDGTMSLDRNTKLSFGDSTIHHEESQSNQNLTIHELEKNFEDRYFPNKYAQTEKNDEKDVTSLPETVSKTDSLKHTSKSSISSKGSAKNKRKSDSISQSFNNTLRTQAVKIKTKLQGIKKPKITIPSPPKLSAVKFKKPDFKKPNIKLPKLPDRPSINLPSFNFTRNDSKKSWRARQFSTESNVGDSKKKIFDFRTYPRIFDKSKSRDKNSSTDNVEPSSTQSEFATVPRVSKNKSKWGDIKKEVAKTPDVIRIPLHSQESMDAPSDIECNTNAVHEEKGECSREIERYVQDAGKEKLNQGRSEEEEEEEEEEEYIPDEHEQDSVFSSEFLKRWEHGEFHEGPQTGRYVDDIHNVDYSPPPEREREDLHTPLEGSTDITPPQEHSSGSLSEHRRGVLEEIDSDEFFLRQKGISQEDIEVGKYLSSEIREAFRKPISALPQLHHSEDREYDMELSDQSEPVRETPRRKPLKKPKRKKTPHVSSEQLSFDRESFNTEPEEYPKDFKEIVLEVLPPIRPSRRNDSRKKKIQKDIDVVPFQETISISEHADTFIHPDYIIAIENSDILRDNILRNDVPYFFENDIQRMYENECMEHFEQPNIKVYDAYNGYENFHGPHQFEDHPPIPPIRKQRSLRSMSPSDQGSIVDEEKHIPLEIVPNYRLDHEYIIPTPEPPERPRRTRSRTRSIPQMEDDRTSREVDSLVSDNHEEIAEVIEEVCIKDVRDTSGYAIIDKTKVRDPPLPPSRLPKTPPRTRRFNKSKEKDKFATVPRLTNETATPVRPLRNYSTLRGTTPTLNDDEKENLNVIHLQSGEVLQKMRDRPLPAPPRPPRKSRSALRDMSHEGNLPTNSQGNLDKLDTTKDQTEIDALHELEDQILPYDFEETITHGSLVLQTFTDPDVVSHSTLKVDNSSPMRVVEVTRESDDTKTTIDDDEEFSKIPDDFKDLVSPPADIFKESSVNENEIQTSPEKLEENSKGPLDFTKHRSQIDESEETSTIPEEFFKLKDPNVQQIESRDDVGVIHDDQEVSVLRAQKLQVADLDVDKLHVNELQASKIIVSELDGISLQVSEINSKCGNLIVSGIDLPPNLIQEMLEKLQIAAHEHAASASVQLPTTETKSEERALQKKTSFEEQTFELEMFETAPPVPPRHDSKTNLLDTNDEKLEEVEEVVTGKIVESVSEELLEPPIRPPRRSSQVEKVAETVDDDLLVNVEQSMVNMKDVEECLIQELIDEAIGGQDAVSIKGDLPSANNLGGEVDKANESTNEIIEQETNKESESPIQETFSKSEDEPPPRPPDPVQAELAYIPSQPPPSFYALRSPHFKEFIDEDIPLPPRRKRHHKPPPPVTASSSEDAVPVSRRHHRSPEPSIPQLTGQLVRLCALEGDRSIRRLITHITHNIVNNVDGKQDLHVVILLLLIVIAGLILLSQPKVTIYESHWDFFNPPTDL